MTDPGTELPEHALRQHDAFLRALAMSLLGDEHLAEDVVQETWLAAVRGRGMQVRRWRSWGSRVVRNLARKTQRSLRRRSDHEWAAPVPEEPPAPDDQLAREEGLRAVTDAVLGLEEPYRSTILMRYYEGLMPRDIARRVAVPVTTVKCRLLRALNQLRSRLDRQTGSRQVWMSFLVELSGHGLLVPPGLVRPAAHAFAENVSPLVEATVMSSKPKLLIAGSGLLVATVGIGVYVATRNPGVGGGAGPTLVGARASEGRATPPVEVADPAAASVVQDELRSPLTGSLTLQVRYADPDQPAPGVGVSLFPGDGPYPLLNKLRLGTDASGRLELEYLLPGRVVLYMDRGGVVSVTIEAGEHAQAIGVIPPGVDVNGRVVDRAGLPVADVEIWLSDHANFANGAPISQTDSQGRFELRSVSGQRAVMARKAGHAPSRGAWIRGRTGSTLPIELVLPGPGAALKVTAVDSDGEPVHARVRIVNPSTIGTRGRDDGLSDVQVIDYVLDTDDTGTVRAVSLTPGNVGVHVNAIGYAPWLSTVEVAAAGEATVSATLTQGASLTGKVTSSLGEPIQDALVRIGGYGQDDTREARTGPDGTYRIVGIAPEPFTVLAYESTSGRAQERLTGSEGAELTWDPVLDPGRVLRGRLVDERGEPLVNWLVNVTPPGYFTSRRVPGPTRPFRGQAHSDHEGGFSVFNCPEGLLEIRPVEPRPAMYPGKEFLLVPADGELREFRALDSVMATAFLRGRVLEAEGRPAAVEVKLSHPVETRVYSFWTQPETGAFRIGPLEPGTYGLSAADGDHGLTELVELGVQDDLDLGNLVLSGPGRLVIALQLPEGVRDEDVSLALESPATRVQARTIPGHELDPAGYELPSGDWTIEVRGAVLPEEHRVTIVPGETAHLELAPRPGARVYLYIHTEGERARQSMTVRVLAPDGTVVLEHEDLLTDSPRMTMVLVPPADSYQVVAESQDGRRGTAWIDRTSMALSGPVNAVRPVEVVLR